MKRQYVRPTCEVISFDRDVVLLAGSNNSFTGKDPDSSDTNPEQSGDGGGGGIPDDWDPIPTTNSPWL